MQELARCRERVAELESLSGTCIGLKKSCESGEERCRRMVNRLSTFTPRAVGCRLRPPLTHRIPAVV